MVVPTSQVMPPPRPSPNHRHLAWVTAGADCASWYEPCACSPTYTTGLPLTVCGYGVVQSTVRGQPRPYRTQPVVRGAWSSIWGQD